MTDSDAPSDRRDPITEQHGDWTITIYDDQPIEEGKKYATNSRVVITHRDRVWREGMYPGYRIYTLLAHWKEDLPDDPFPPDTPSDRDFEGLVEILWPGHYRPEDVAHRILASDWLAQQQAEMYEQGVKNGQAQAHAPIWALLDADWQGHYRGTEPAIPLRRVRAALDPAAVADHERDLRAEAREAEREYLFNRVSEFAESFGVTPIEVPALTVLVLGDPGEGDMEWAQKVAIEIARDHPDTLGGDDR